jgi:hypothetical protein
MPAIKPEIRKWGSAPLFQTGIAIRFLVQIYPDCARICSLIDEKKIRYGLLHSDSHFLRYPAEKFNQKKVLV